MNILVNWEGKIPALPLEVKIFHRMMGLMMAGAGILDIRISILPESYPRLFMLATTTGFEPCH